MDQKEPEFSKILDTSRLCDAEEVWAISPNKEESLKLAERLGLLSLEDFQSNISIKRYETLKIIKIRGKFSAKFVQECVAGGGDIESAMEESFLLDLYYGPDKADNEDEDLGETMIIRYGEKLDLGELLVQYLSLSLPRYPRSNVPYLDYIEDDTEEEKQSSFSALSKLKSGSNLKGSS